MTNMTITTPENNTNTGTVDFFKEMDSIDKAVSSESRDIIATIERYKKATSEYLRNLDMRDLVVKKLPKIKNVRVRYVQNSRFWDALDRAAEKVDYVRENIERAEEKEAAKQRTREEWESMEQRIVGEKPTPDAGYQVCGTWNCKKIYKTVNKRTSKYCSEACRNEQKAAAKRLRDTGTYLPVKVYESYRSDYLSNIHKEYEVSLNAAYSYATDGRVYKNPGRRSLTTREMIEIDEIKKEDNRELSEVKTSKWSKEQMEKYLTTQYSNLSHLPWSTNLINTNDRNQITYNNPPWWG